MRSPSRAPKGLAAYVPGQVLVRIRPAAVRPHLPATGLGSGPSLRGGRRTARALAGAVPREVAEPVDKLRRDLGLKDIRPLFEQEAATEERRRVATGSGQRTRVALAQSVLASDDDELAGLAIATLPKNQDPVAAAKLLRSSNAVDFAEPVAARWLLRARADPKRNLQWGLAATRWFDAKPRGRGDVRIGVIDTGIDLAHPDLDAERIDYDAQGSGRRDLDGHGTHVAGIIAATANNGVGITGLTPCRLSVWKVFGDDLEPDGAYLVDTDLYRNALRAAELKGLHALNLSLGGTARDRVEELLIRRLARRGVVVCAAMGNEYEEGDPVEYPAAFDATIAVGAIAADRRRSWFSCTGRHIDLVAPGSDVLSTLPTRRSPWREETGYAPLDGTSMATPYVTAAAALVARGHAAFGPSEVRDHLRKSAAKLTAMRGKDWTREYGAGLLDFAAAVS